MNTIIKSKAFSTMNKRKGEKRLEVERDSHSMISQQNINPNLEKKRAGNKAKSVPRISFTNTCENVISSNQISGDCASRRKWRLDIITSRHALDASSMVLGAIQQVLYFTGCSGFKENMVFSIL